MKPRKAGDLNTMRPLVRCSTGKTIRWAVIRIHFKINFHSSHSCPQIPSTITFSGCCFCASPTGPDRCYANYLYKTHDREAKVQQPHSFFLTKDVNVPTNVITAWPMR
jgi:hypothetical protein